MQMREKESLELSVIMPCHNEENTVSICVEEALAFFRSNSISGEVLVVDNASTDASADRALEQGARVVKEANKGYGKAIQTGLVNSKGRVIIIGDCDTTYDFLHMNAMYQMLVNNQCDIIIGNRFAEEMEAGSMSLLHQWGVKVLSFFGRKRFHTDVYDFHCGLRGMRREIAEQLVFHTIGMEFATEMIAEAAKHGLRIMQIPIHLRKCNHERKSKLRTFRDGLRHLVYIINN